MKIFDVGSVEEVSSVIELWFYIFLYDHLLRFGYGLECDLLPIPTRVFISMGEFVVVDWMYQSCDRLSGRVSFLVRLNHFIYE